MLQTHSINVLSFSKGLSNSKEKDKKWALRLLYNAVGQSQEAREHALCVLVVLGYGLSVTT